MATLSLLIGCGSSKPVSYRPFGKRALLKRTPAPVAPGVVGAQPVAKGSGMAPVRGIEHQEWYLWHSIRGGKSPYGIDKRRWSEYFRDAIGKELARLGVPTSSGPEVSVDIRSLDVDESILGPTTCRLEAHAIVRDGGLQRVYPIAADGMADKPHRCIGRAVAAAVRHIVSAPWLANEVLHAPGGPSTMLAPRERTGLLSGTAGRYNFQLGAQVGANAIRIKTDDGHVNEVVMAYGLVLDLEIRRDFFFSGSVIGDRRTNLAIGVGFSYYLDSSVLLSGSFLAGGVGTDTQEDFDIALGGQLLVGKQWRVLRSTWLGVAARPFALWGFDGNRGYGMALLGTVSVN